MRRHDEHAMFLALFNELMTGGPASEAEVPVHVLDQLTAARRETEEELRKLGNALLRNPVAVHSLSADALLSASLWLPAQVCQHLQGEAIRPAIYLPASRLLVCGSDCITPVRQLARNQCDICRAKGVERFTSVAAMIESVVVLADCCDWCLDQLGVKPGLRLPPSLG